MDITLVSVNWNQRRVMELMLKSYVTHHYQGEPLKLLLVDNGSEDDSKVWLDENQIPYVDNAQNIGHENSLNQIYDRITTQYCLLVDTDVQFEMNVWDYADLFTNNIISAGELITRDHNIRHRISPWFWLFDIQKMKSAGVNCFRDVNNTSWDYDVGSWYWEKMCEARYSNHHIPMIGGGVDDMPGMIYEWGVHFGKMSWHLGNHEDRRDEINMRYEILL